MEKIIKLCREGSCCPMVRITDDKVTIGEEDNTCVLTSEQWDILKEKILHKDRKLWTKIIFFLRYTENIGLTYKMLS